MKAERSQSTQCYTWSNHGNLGDDWIGEVSQQYFDGVVSVREKRSMNPFHFGRHRLVRDDGKPASDSLVLWGGGWVAADRPGSRTMRAWSRHVTAQARDIVGVGLGIGPFVDLAPEQHSHIQSFFGAFRGRLGVRTFADLEHVPNGYSAQVGCDIALLDKRFLGGWRYTGSDSGYVIFSFPAYSAHWMTARPWMSQEWYRSQIGEIAERVSRTHRVLFVEFDQMTGLTSDSSYWSHLPVTVVRPGSVQEAAELFSGAKHVYAGRLHAAILGALVGNPTLAMAYHHKFEVVAELGIPTVGLTAPSVSVRDPGPADPSVLQAVRQRGLGVLASVTAQ